MENIDPSIVDSWIQGIDDDVERISSSPIAGSVWYIVSMKWLNQWRLKYGLKIEEMDIDNDLTEQQNDTNDLIPMDLDDCSKQDEENKSSGPLNSNSKDLDLEDKEKNNDLALEGEENQEKVNQIYESPINKFLEIGPVNSKDILDINPIYEPELILKKGLTISKDYEILPPKA